MTTEITIPLLPCRSIDAVLEFYQPADCRRLGARTGRFQAGARNPRRDAAG
jgi:hypothetical protein